MGRWDRFYPAVRKRLVQRLAEAENPEDRVRYARSILVLERTNLSYVTRNNPPQKDSNGQE